MALAEGDLPRESNRALLEALSQMFGGPVTPMLLATLVTGMESVRNLERIARALASRGVPVVRTTPPLTQIRDRYMVEFINPVDRGVYNVQALSPPSNELYLAKAVPGRPSVPLVGGRPSLVFHAIRALLGLRRR